MVLFENAERLSDDLVTEFQQAYFKGAKAVPYHVLKDAVLSNMKQNEVELKAAA